jgi:four helix bundle protein
MTSSIIQEKSYSFGLQVIHLCRSIAEKHREYILTKHLMKSGTSIGANIQEASEAQSRKDFISKLSISLKEVKETEYWLRLIRDSNLASTVVMKGHIDQCNELKYLLIASIKTAKNNDR